MLHLIAFTEYGRALNLAETFCEMMSELGLWWQHTADIGRERIDMSYQDANRAPGSLNHTLYLNASQVI